MEGTVSRFHASMERAIFLGRGILLMKLAVHFHPLMMKILMLLLPRRVVTALQIRRSRVVFGGHLMAVIALRTGQSIA